MAAERLRETRIRQDKRDVISLARTSDRNRRLRWLLHHSYEAALPSRRYFYSRDKSAASRASPRGSYTASLALNEGIISTEIAPFAEGKWHRPRGSKYGVEVFLEVKYLCMGGIDR
jgi:hypothetical protein